MPKGSKRRKAARRRQHQQHPQLLESPRGSHHHHHLPDSPTNSTSTANSTASAASLSQQGNSSPRHGRKRMDTTSSSSSSSSSDDEEAAPVKSVPDAPTEDSPPPPPPPPPPAAADGPEGPAEDKEVVVESNGAEDVVVEMVQAEEIREAGAADELAPEEGGPDKEGTALSQVALAVASAVPADAPAVTEAVEAAGGTLEAPLDVSALAHGTTDVQPELALDAPVSELPREGGGDVAGETATASESSRPQLLEHKTSWWSCCGLFDVLGGSKDSARA